MQFLFAEKNKFLCTVLRCKIRLLEAVTVLRCSHLLETDSVNSVCSGEWHQESWNVRTYFEGNAPAHTSCSWWCIEGQERHYLWFWQMQSDPLQIKCVTTPHSSESSSGVICQRWNNFLFVPNQTRSWRFDQRQLSHPVSGV